MKSTVFKKFTAWLLTLAMLMTFIPSFSIVASAATVASGTCGTGVNWLLDDADTLTIYGTGAIDSYNNGSQPWYDYKDSIKTVIIAKGVTSISAYAFYEFTALETVKIAGSVTSIGTEAFGNCSTPMTAEYYGSGYDYSVGDDMTVTEDITLYAQWVLPLNELDSFNDGDYEQSGNASSPYTFKMKNGAILYASVLSPAK